MTMHSNSLNAYQEERERLSNRCKEILIWLHFIDPAGLGSFTDREIKHGMQKDDMNQVRPRITDLIYRGFLRQVGKTKCTTTGKKVRLVGIVNQEQVRHENRLDEAIE